MKVLKTLDDMKAWSRKVRQDGQTLGLVPTMGYLHAGHLSLARKSMSVCDRTVVSIFVNPTQFGPNEDLDTYPRNLEADRKELEQLGVDALFLPTGEDMYPEGFQTYVHVEEITDKLCGNSRRELFRGVTTIVLKLFNIVQPHSAFFGEKDRQQLEVIRKMVDDLNLDVEVVGLPIIREPDGLAMSSRNKYLGKAERKTALSLHEALQKAQQWVAQGESSVDALRSRMRTIIEREGQAKVDYISVCDPKRFEELEEIQGQAMIALAVHVGKARLIDNCLIERI
ncbi:MAG: pantoate--beta-alanine ligase [Nitrospinota bacterium]|jgi:pantoate--beta-alanine ligase|nr:pantoate--beta-alanine ligase [Nitrospinota bacterium]MDH5789696.1 pantoate--beta-alanine ligase [Nitrospinota bacterium]